MSALGEESPAANACQLAVGVLGAHGHSVKPESAVLNTPQEKLHNRPWAVPTHEPSLRQLTHPLTKVVCRMEARPISARLGARFGVTPERPA